MQSRCCARCSRSSVSGPTCCPFTDECLLGNVPIARKPRESSPATRKRSPPPLRGAGRSTFIQRGFIDSKIWIGVSGAVFRCKALVRIENPSGYNARRDCRGGIARMMDDLFHLEARARFIINAAGQRFLRFFYSPPVARYHEAIHPFPGKGPRSVCPKGCFDRSRILLNIL